MCLPQLPRLVVASKQSPPPKYWTSVWQELISACMFDINPAALGNDRKQCLHNSVTKLVLRSFVCQWLLVPQSFVSPGQCTNCLAHCSSCTQMDHVPATFTWSVWLHGSLCCLPSVPLLLPKQWCLVFRGCVHLSARVSTTKLCHQASVPTLFTVPLAHKHTTTKKYLTQFVPLLVPQSFVSSGILVYDYHREICINLEKNVSKSKKSEGKRNLLVCWSCPPSDCSTFLYLVGREGI